MKQLKIGGLYQLHAPDCDTEENLWHAFWGAFPMTHVAENDSLEDVFVSSGQGRAIEEIFKNKEILLVYLGNIKRHHCDFERKYYKFLCGNLVLYLRNTVFSPDSYLYVKEFYTKTK